MAVNPRHPGRASAGFTLTELMVVVTILALTAMIAVPALTRDRIEARFNGYLRTFAHDVRRAHMEAISTKDHYQFTVSSGGYSVSSVVVSSGSVTPSLLLTRAVPEGVTITGVLQTTALPGGSYSPPSSMSGQVTFRLEATGGLSVEKSSTSFVPSSISVFFKSTQGGYKGRVVIYQTTCQTQVYDRWQ